MIISHKYKFLFIEIDLTASWAIHHELIQNYEGQSILHKHATYSEFRRQASGEQLTYFVFATVRNPLDKIVSRYFKLKNNQKEAFSDANSLPQGIIDYSDLNKYQYVRSFGIDFENYFRKYYKIPYSDMIDLSSKYLNYVIYYENIQQAFTKLLTEFKVEQIRPLAHINKTPEKLRDFLAYYPPAIVPLVKRVCGPYMKKWNYQFPEQWGDNRVSIVEDMEYRALNKIRFLYTVYLRYNNAPYALFLRKVRAKLLP
jgi:hypothetical protein